MSDPSDIESNFGTTNDGPQYDKCIYGDAMVEPAGATAGAGSTNFSGPQYDNEKGGGSSPSSGDSTTMTVNQGNFEGRGKGTNGPMEDVPSNGKQYGKA